MGYIMTFKSRLYATAALISFITVAPLASAQAGQLFPPGNTINNDATNDCPTGSTLSWNGAKGTVECTGISTATNCPAGQVLTSIKNGAPVCGSPMVVNGREDITGFSNKVVSITLSQPGFLQASCYVDAHFGNHAYTGGQEAGTLAVVYVDGQKCGIDRSFQYPSSNISFADTTYCGENVTAGEHTLTCGVWPYGQDVGGENDDLHNPLMSYTSGAMSYFVLSQ